MGKEIILGEYKDPEFRLASFFHELGHIRARGVWKNKYQQEEAAWKYGFRLAKKHGVSFSDKTRGWATEQLQSYKQYA